MKNMLAITAAAAAFVFTASAGFAQDAVTAAPEPYYVQEGADGVFMYREDDMENRLSVLGDDTFAAPGECPDGSFFRSSATTVTACGMDGIVYTLSDLEAGSMMSNNKPFPEGTTSRAIPSEGDN